jgi:hypothetical protein
MTQKAFFLKKKNPFLILKKRKIIIRSDSVKKDCFVNFFDASFIAMAFFDKYNHT